MAGFGAGFGKAFGGSLEAAGKLHQEEQLRTREYERAKADRQAEIADTRSYQERIAAEERERAAEEKTHRYSKGPDGKFYYTRLDGTKVEKDANDPGVRLYLQDEEKREQDRTMFGLDVAGKKVGIRRDEAAIRASDATVANQKAQTKAAAGRIPDDLYAKIQFDLKPVSAQYDNLDKTTQGIIDGLRQANSNPKLDPKTRAKNDALLKEALGLRSSIIGSQQALSAEYVSSGYTLNPSELLTPKLNELRAKFPNAWNRFDSVNKANNAQAAEAKRAANARAVQMPKL